MTTAIRRCLILVPLALQRRRGTATPAPAMGPYQPGDCASPMSTFPMHHQHRHRLVELPTIPAPSLRSPKRIVNPIPPPLNRTLFSSQRPLSYRTFSFTPLVPLIHRTAHPPIVPASVGHYPSTLNTRGPSCTRSARSAPPPRYSQSLSAEIAWLAVHSHLRCGATHGRSKAAQPQHVWVQNCW